MLRIESLPRIPHGAQPPRRRAAAVRAWFILLHNSRRWEDQMEGGEERYLDDQSENGNGDAVHLVVLAMLKSDAAFREAVLGYKGRRFATKEMIAAAESP